MGVTHAFNLIDGPKRFLCFVSMGVCAALKTIRAEVGLLAYFQVLFLLLTALASVWVVNFPLGRIFMEDIEAHLVGYIFVWTAVSVVWTSPEVSTFVILLIFGHCGHFPRHLAADYPKGGCGAS